MCNHENISQATSSSWESVCADCGEVLSSVAEDVKHLKQPKRSKTCGQHCVAMLANVPVASVIERFGNRSTTPSQLLEIVGECGLRATTALWQIPRSAADMPSTGILKLRKKGRRNFHWACVINGVIHDPACDTAGAIVRNYEVVAFISITTK